SNGHLPTQNSALGRRIYQSGPTRSSIPAEEVVESEWLTTIIAIARSETGRYRSFRRTCRDRQHLAHAAADPPSRPFRGNHFYEIVDIAPQKRFRMQADEVRQRGQQVIGVELAEFRIMPFVDAQ